MIYHMTELFRAWKKSLQIYSLFPTIPLFGLWNHVIKPCDIIGYDGSEKCNKYDRVLASRQAPSLKKWREFRQSWKLKQKKNGKRYQRSGNSKVPDRVGFSRHKKPGCRMKDANVAITLLEKSEKWPDKIQALNSTEQDSNPRPLRYRCNALQTELSKPHESGLVWARPFICL